MFGPRERATLVAIAIAAAAVGLGSGCRASAPLPAAAKPSSPDIAQTNMIDPLGVGAKTHASFRVDPSPSFSPSQVVRTQLAALKRNDDPYPNAGIAIAFGFASPSNRAYSGPLSRFTRMLKNVRYRDLLDHRRAVVGRTTLRGRRARVPTIVFARTGQLVGYVFLLSLQARRPFTGCWMTDGVGRFSVPQPTGGAVE